jgi:hypothetical protein
MPVKAVRLLRRYALLFVASFGQQHFVQNLPPFLQLAAAGFLKTSVPILHTTRYHIPEDHNLTCLVV